MIQLLLRSFETTANPSNYAPIISHLPNRPNKWNDCYISYHFLAYWILDHDDFLASTSYGKVISFTYDDGWRNTDIFLQAFL